MWGWAAGSLAGATAAARAVAWPAEGAGVWLSMVLPEGAGCLGVCSDGSSTRAAGPPTIAGTNWLFRPVPTSPVYRYQPSPAAMRSGRISCRARGAGGSAGFTAWQAFRAAWRSRASSAARPSRARPLAVGDEGLVVVEEAAHAVGELGGRCQGVHLVAQQAHTRDGHLGHPAGRVGRGCLSHAKDGQGPFWLHTCAAADSLGAAGARGASGGWQTIIGMAG